MAKDGEAPAARRGAATGERRRKDAGQAFQEGLEPGTPGPSSEEPGSPDGGGAAGPAPCGYPGGDEDEPVTAIGTPAPAEDAEALDRAPTGRREARPSGGWNGPWVVQRTAEGDDAEDDLPDLTADDFVAYYPDLQETVPLQAVQMMPDAGEQSPRPRSYTPSPPRSHTPPPPPQRAATPQPQRGSTPPPGQRGHTPPPGAAAPYLRPEHVRAVPVEGPGAGMGEGRASSGLERILDEPAYEPLSEDDVAYASFEPVTPSLALTAPYVPRRPAVPSHLDQGIAEWEDQPTSLYQGRSSTAPPPPEPVGRTTTSHAMIVHPAAGAIEAFQDLVGGPLTARRHVSIEELAAVQHLPALLEPDSLGANQYRLLGQKLEEAASIDFCRTAAVTSACAGDGKTVTALNLALILAEEPNRRVGLIDCNLRSPKLARLLSLPDEGGLVGVYRRQLTLAEALIRVGDRELYLLPAGEPYANPTEIIRSPLLTAIVRKMETELSIVVIDTPSIMPSADVNLLSRLVDRFIIVVRAGVTRRDLLAEALRRLDESKVLGLVFNEAEEE